MVDEPLTDLSNFVDTNLTNISMFPDVIPQISNPHLIRSSSPKPESQGVGLGIPSRPSTRKSSVNSSHSGTVNFTREDDKRMYNELAELGKRFKYLTSLSRSKGKELFQDDGEVSSSDGSSSSTNGSANLKKVIRRYSSLVGKLETDPTIHPFVVDDSHFEITDMSDDESFSRPSSSSVLEVVRATATQNGNPIRRTENGTVSRSTVNLREHDENTKRSIRRGVEREQRYLMMKEHRVPMTIVSKNAHNHGVKDDRRSSDVVNHSARALCDEYLDEEPRRSHSETFTVPLPHFAVPDYTQRAPRRAESLTISGSRNRNKVVGPGAGAPVRDVHRQPLDVNALQARRRFPEKARRKLGGAGVLSRLHGRKPSSDRRTRGRSTSPNRERRGNGRRTGQSTSPVKKLVPFIPTAKTGMSTHSLQANCQLVLSLLRQYLPQYERLKREILLTSSCSAPDVCKRFHRESTTIMDDLDLQYKRELARYESSDDILERRDLDRSMDKAEKTYDTLAKVVKKLDVFVQSSRPLSGHNDNGGIVHQLKRLNTRSRFLHEAVFGIHQHAGPSLGPSLAPGELKSVERESEDRRDSERS